MFEHVASYQYETRYMYTHQSKFMDTDCTQLRINDISICYHRMLWNTCMMHWIQDHLLKLRWVYIMHCTTLIHSSYRRGPGDIEAVSWSCTSSCDYHMHQYKSKQIVTWLISLKNQDSSPMSSDILFLLCMVGSGDQKLALYMCTELKYIVSHEQEAIKCLTANLHVNKVPDEVLEVSILTVHACNSV